MKCKCITNSLAQTQRLGLVLAKQFLKSKPKKTALVLGLIGDLGGGKTTFLQGFARGLNIKQKILSPTFVIMKRFAIPHPLTVNQQATFGNFYHLDCYRISNPEDVLNLGFADIIKNPKNIVAIEWADKISEFIPRESIILEFKFLNKTQREVRICKYSLVDIRPLDKIIKFCKIQ